MKSYKMITLKTHDYFNTKGIHKEAKEIMTTFHAKTLPVEELNELVKTFKYELCDSIEITNLVVENGIATIIYRHNKGEIRKL